MSRFIFLDSGPLSLLTQRRSVAAAEACRAWLATHLAQRNRVFVPEVVDYELRRELLRAGKSAAVSRLDSFETAALDRYLPLTTEAMRLAAELWADIRRRGLPTTDPRELDVDVILAAQALTSGFPPADLVVATTNAAHLSRLVTAEMWDRI